jgi:uncharacterized protein YggE
MPMRSATAGVFLVTATLVMAAWPRAVHAQDGTPPPRLDVVVASGEATIKAAPDQAFVSIAVESRAKTPREAQRQTAEAMTAVQQKLRGLGLAPDAVRTLAIELSPEFDYADGRQQLRGYVSRNRIEVRVDALERLGDVVDASVGSGATNVTDVRFDVRRRDELEREALKQAVAQARARAEAAASGAGRSIDRVVRIEDAGTFSPPPPRPLMMAARAEMAAAPSTPVAPGELEIVARVTLTAALK